MTLAVWIKVNADEGEGQFISKPWNTWGDYNYYIRFLSDSRIRIRIDGLESYNLETDNSISKQEWHHIAGTVDSSKQVKIYIDGIKVKEGTHSITDWNPSDGDDNRPLTIGTRFPYGDGWAGDTVKSFNGTIDEVMIFNKALTPAEVKAIYINQN
ncbi:hypothetical protein GF386_04575 [Candidatus Pacearchaeota archaeon]|nr:hypothetical protein [Candidatus Pacearchaeota archaeon]MBD3283400.1 hypothetical protein [Candidatus Pacearchaeota archaeon]